MTRRMLDLTQVPKQWKEGKRCLFLTAIGFALWTSIILLFMWWGVL